MPRGRNEVSQHRAVFDGSRNGSYRNGEPLANIAERPAVDSVPANLRGRARPLASGKYDALSGLYPTPFDDFDVILNPHAQIESDKLHRLQIRTQKVSSAAAGVAAIRDAAGRGAAARANKENEEPERS